MKFLKRSFVLLFLRLWRLLAFFFFLIFSELILIRTEFLFAIVIFIFFVAFVVEFFLLQYLIAVFVLLVDYFEFWEPK